MKTALLVLDVQNDYFPDGKMETHKPLEASLEIQKLMTHFRNRAMPVIHVQHISARPGASFLLPDTSGIDFHKNVKPAKGEKIIIKNYPNSFRETELESYLKENNISKLVITGMMTHMCVDTTVRAAYDLGYECVVAGDACATRALKVLGNEISAENVQGSFLAALNGLFAKVLKTSEIIEFTK